MIYNVVDIINNKVYIRQMTNRLYIKTNYKASINYTHIILYLQTHTHTNIFINIIPCCCLTMSHVILLTSPLNVIHITILVH